MSKLLARAKVKYSLAENCYRRIADDDVFTDECCYNLQQAIELSLKFIVEMNAGEYIENHDIRVNLNKLSAMHVNVPCFAELKSIAAELLSWNTESRYNDNFVALQDDMETARRCAAELVNFADSLISQKKNEIMEEFPAERL